MRCYGLYPNRKWLQFCAGRSLLSANAKITVTPHQYFALSAPGEESLTLVPLLYDAYPPLEATEPGVCGVIFRSRNRPAYFVQIMGVRAMLGNMSDNCGGIIAMGKALDPGPRPRLTAIVEGISGHADEYSLAVVLVWDHSARRYAVDQRTSDSIGNVLAPKGQRATVPGVRALLRDHY